MVHGSGSGVGVVFIVGDRVTVIVTASVRVRVIVRVRVLAIGHWHVCRFMQHFSNYIRVERHYNGNYTQEPQNMAMGGCL